MKRLSLRVRLMLLMICLTTLPVVTITIVATMNTRNSVESEIIDANESRMAWADQYLEELIAQINTLFYTLQIDEQLMAGLQAEDSSVTTQLTLRNYIRDTLATTFYANSRKVDGITLYMDATQKALSVDYSNSGLFHSLDIEAVNWSRMRDKPINMYFKQSGRSIAAYHSINRFEDRKFLGGISVRINQGVWEELANILKSESDSAVYLLNDEGELLSGSTSQSATGEVFQHLQQFQKQTDNQLHFDRTDTHFYFTQRVGDGAITILKTIPLQTVNESANDTIKAGWVTGSLFVGVSILLSILLSIRISKPIVSLARTMRNTQLQNFEFKSVRNRDEIGLLEQGYYSMMKRLKELIEHEYQREIEVKDAQLKALQAQINPHFLNNTLGLIGGMALSRNAPEIYRMTKVIGDLLRYSISESGDLVTIESELTHAKNYLHIQEQRFRGRCQVLINEPPNLPECRIPKFTLQPIIENAFEHGLQRKEGNWTLEIRIARVGSRICMLVKDNGAGTSDTRLHQLREELRNSTRNQEVVYKSSTQKQRGIGLLNVHSRLKLQFGKRAGVRLFSKQGAGTLICIMIPITQEERETNEQPEMLDRG